MDIKIFETFQILSRQDFVKQKNTHPEWVEEPATQFSARSAEPFERKRGKTCLRSPKDRL